MSEFYPYFTNDGSVGLYSYIVDDIYHSTYGALTEAYEKFILPAELDNYFLNKNEIKILDICFGIGYNTKSFLNYFFENIYEKNLLDNEHNGTIYTYNKNIAKYKNPISNKIKNKIFITAIDTDKNLCYLSPFIKINGKNKGMLFKNNEIEKLSKTKVKKYFKLKKEINIILINKLLDENPDFLNNDNLEKILAERKYKPFFDNDIIKYYKFKQKIRYDKTYLSGLKGILHNIYYKYVSLRYKRALRWLKLNEFCFNYKNEDARMALIKDTLSYNYIFLDAFTPTKSPCLWTIDFFKLLYEHLNDDGMILTYSTAANIRNAFLQNNFYIGKIWSDISKKYVGTIAVKNKSLIKHELSQFDLGLLKTKAGVIYRDKKLDASNEQIIAVQNLEAKNSGLMSSSRYNSRYKTVE